MSFSRSQHITHFRPMVERAWRAHVRLNPTAPGLLRPLSAARRQWYERELQEAIGVTSTNEANPRADFEKAMAHFEAIAGDSIEWQLKLYSGDARRVLHRIRDLCRNFDIDESYARGIARQALKLDSLPDIGTLDAPKLVIVLRALKIHTKRPHDVASAVPAEKEIPF